MDKILRESLIKIHKQIKLLFDAEKLYGELEASEKTLYAALFLETDDSKSIEVRKNMVYASQAWINFIKGLSIAEAAKNRERRVLELLNAAFQAEYLTYKIEHSVIKKEI